MKLIYIANIRLPTEKAHGLQIMKTCEALAQRGEKLTLVVPSRRNPIHADPFVFYGIVHKNFSISTLPTPEFWWLGRCGFLLHTTIFALRARALVRRSGADAVYSRDHLVLALFALLGVRAPLFYEAHMGNWNIAARFMMRHVSGVMCITRGLKDFYISKGVSAQKTLVAPDAVDSGLFDNLPDQQTCRSHVGLPVDKKIVLYAGSFSLYAWKGLDVFLSTARLCGDPCVFVALGGTKKEIENRERAGIGSNVVLREKVSPGAVPQYIKAADVLVLPNKTGDIVSEKYTSPMKLFEYMASGVPLVASRVPSIQEIINDTNGILVEPNDPAALRDGVTKALAEGGARAERARSEARELYSWTRRAETIVQFLQSHITSHVS